MIRKLMRVLHREPASKSVAKNRLQLILVQDRVGANEDVMKDLQVKLTELLGQYFEFLSKQPFCNLIYHICSSQKYLVEVH